jgi:hypothetical protein
MPGHCFGIDQYDRRRVPNMQDSHIANLAAMSPHKLFQDLWKAVETGNHDDVQQLVDLLVHALGGNQVLATGAVTDLVETAIRHQCTLETKKALTRLPGFDADAPITRGGPTLADYVLHQGDLEFATYLLQPGMETGQPPTLFRREDTTKDRRQY